MSVNSERAAIVDFDDPSILFYDFNDYIWIKRTVFLILDFIFNTMETMHSKSILSTEKKIKLKKLKKKSKIKKNEIKSQPYLKKSDPCSVV